MAFQTALRHPQAIRTLVLVSTHMQRAVIPAAIRAQQQHMAAAAAQALRGTPLHEAYQRLAPRPEDFPRLLDKLGALVRQDFDFRDEVRDLRVPTLIVAADADMAPPSHYAEVFALLEGGLRDGDWDRSGRPRGGHALAILPGLTHYDIVTSPLLATTVRAFLDG